MREKLVEYLQTFLPMFYKKLMKDLAFHGISKQQLWLLFLIQKDDEKPMKFYSEKMMIPKSNLTAIVDKLIEDGLIERVFDPNDRRVTLLKITENGKNFIEEHKNEHRQAILKKLEALDETDVQRLNQIFEEMKTIFNKIEQ